ncbi:MAG: hypothetical protein ACJ8IR_13050 [Alphaproteobacteria bacterium]|jgi:hypothetical protein
MSNRDSKTAVKAAKKAQSRKVDEQVEETFPASDPPAFMGGKHIVGAPKRRETPAPDCAKPKK